MKVKMPNTRFHRRPCQGRTGFSSIEVTAVAAVIAVLALILIPAVNKRVDDSKIAAAKDDLSAIQKAEELAYGYTGHYFRLCDLSRPESDNPNPTPGTPAYTDAALRVPKAYWNGPIMNQSETTYLIANWKGPFLVPHRSKGLADLVKERPDLVNSYGMTTVGAVDGMGGPIFLYDGDDINWKFTSGGAVAGVTQTGEILEPTQYPVDPWGNPYIFFGSGRYVQPAGVQSWTLDQNNNWGTAAVYCLGPDGSAGLLSQIDPINARNPKAYFRELWTLGTGDDLKREF